MNLVSPTVEKKFFEKITKTETCWLWNGPKNNCGYGIFNTKMTVKRSLSAHRFSYELVKGSIPKGMVIDHLCKTRNCVNPGHLEVVTYSENTRRSHASFWINSNKTQCPNGHLYNEENTYVRRNNSRQCRQCDKLAQRVRRVTKRLKREVAN